MLIDIRKTYSVTVSDKKVATAIAAISLQSRNIYNGVLTTLRNAQPPFTDKKLPVANPDFWLEQIHYGINGAFNIARKALSCVRFDLNIPSIFGFINIKKFNFDAAVLESLLCGTM